MGNILIAKCSNCGYNSGKLFYGGGMLNHLTYCGYPFINLDTDEIEMENIFNKENILKDNNNLIFYDSDSLIKKKVIKKGYFHQWGENYIHRGEVYYCPKCKEYRLEFYPYGCWD